MRTFRTWFLAGAGLVAGWWVVLQLAYFVDALFYAYVISIIEGTGVIL